MRTEGLTAMAGSACLSDAILTAYHAGQLAGDDWQSAADHLRECPTCLSRIEKLPTTDPILVALRHAPAEPTPDDDAFRRALAKLTELEPRSSADHVGVGSTFADYQILEPLGEGGMGAVFKARHTRLDRIVAVKVLRAAGAIRPQLPASIGKSARPASSATSTSSRRPMPAKRTASRSSSWNSSRARTLHASSASAGRCGNAMPAKSSGKPPSASRMHTQPA